MHAIHRKNGAGIVPLTPVDAVAAGQIVLLPDGRPGVAVVALAAGETGEFYTEGLFDIATDPSLVFAAYEDAYWDEANGIAVPVGAVGAGAPRLGPVVGVTGDGKVSGDAFARIDLAAVQAVVKP